MLGALIRHYMAANYAPRVKDVESVAVGDLRDVTENDIAPLMMPIKLMARFRPLERRKAG